MNFYLNEMNTQKLNPNSIYDIIQYKEVVTKFGKTYILTDKDLNQYWSLTSITKFIQQNKIRNIPNNKSKAILKIRTYDYETFDTEDGKQITYLKCNFN